MKRLLVTLKLLAITGVACFAQEEKIEADRPSNTQSTSLVKKGYIQLEAGFDKMQQRETGYSLTEPDLVIKYGLSKRLELRAELMEEAEKLLGETSATRGLQPVELGAKLALFEQKNWLPETAFYTQVGFPGLASKAYKTDYLSPKVRLLFNNDIGKKISLAYNAGIEWQGNDDPPQWVYTFAPQIELGEKWEAFLETFAYLQKGSAPQHHLDGGFAFYPTTNLKLDFWGGKGLSEEAPDYFFSLGVSFRLKP